MDTDNQYGITVLHPLSGKDPDWTPQPSPLIFDLVAIHGLNGHPFETWTHKQSRVMWLRDLLPESLPQIRIMTYGYNANFRNFTGHQDLRSIAKKLLSELVDLRRTEDEIHRPLAFICHSLGGIIAKKALLVGCTREEKQVQDSVFGIIFLGTPHSGSTIANVGRIVANIVSACTPANPAKSLLRTLRPESRTLFEITEDFIQLSPRLKLVSFYEMEMTSLDSLGIFKRMVVEHRSAILNLPNEVAIGQNANHREIARFKSKNDRNFRPVVSRLIKFRRDLESQGGLERNMSMGDIGVEVSAIEGTFSIFELPFPPCRTFQGREELLDRMSQHFYKSSVASEQRTYAICGLGGSGKTQTALKFAAQNRKWYKSGVVFINASSLATVTADFDRICDLMKLGSSSNKAETVKRWLSDRKNAEWLLIFDNADNLASVCVSNYFPATSWGHIIITSRDESAIGLVGQDGSSLEPLRHSEAVALLLNKSGINSASSEDQKQAHEIVDLLGCLPLALDQAGAFIRVRHKSFTDYIRLYHTQQHELLEFQPKLSSYDKTVLTAWNVNFKQVEDESEDAAFLLLLFCFLDPGDIRESMLLRGCTPQRRWNKHGNIEEIDAQESGVSSYLIHLITDEMCYDAAVEKLLSFSLIRRNNDFNEARSLSLHPLVQYCASQRVSQSQQNAWRLQAILLVSHAFPRNQYIEDRHVAPVENYHLLDLQTLTFSSFGNDGRAQLPHVARILAEYNKLACDTYINGEVKRTVASMLISASRFSDRAWKEDVVSRAKQLLQYETDRDLQAALALRQSTLSRMYKRREDSQQMLEAFVHANMSSNENLKEEGDARWNALRGELVISYAENLIQGNDLPTAKKELLGWKPLLSPLSIMECLVLRTRDTNLARILRDEGNFNEAVTYLESLYEAAQSDEHSEHTGQRRIIMSNMADMYCELGRPIDAINLVEPELTHMREVNSETISSGRRLQLCLAEGQTISGRYTEAEDTLQVLKKTSEAIVSPDIITLGVIFRTWSGLARIAHQRAEWMQALSYWKEALQAGKRCKWDQEFPLNIVRYSIAHLLFELQDKDRGLIYLHDARASFDEHGVKYWAVGLGTYWYEYLKGRMNAFSGGGLREHCDYKKL